ncbi:MAG: phosphodiester glycosidase family protein, partial [Candidatus Omnitrophica bacterium]|nr:phosphodiester glycosidase family protein [Candidatus Omnitrophota bacterium]
ATSGETTSRLAARFDLQVAVNGSHFFPFRSETPWDYYPRRGEPVDVLGVAVSDHEPYSQSFSQWPKFCFEEERAYLCGAEGMKSAPHAISGQRLLVRRGSRNANMQGPLPQEPLPRTAVGIDASGKKVWLVVVDGRQKNYSEGLSLFELGDFLQQLGAYYALNLDGGGSTTMVAEMDGRLKVLNAPYHVHIPMRERPVANALGVSIREP